jgi:hypothetical protein
MVDPPFYRRSQEPRKSWFPSWAYYVVSALLFLPTIPMYRAILAAHGVVFSAPTAKPAPSAGPRLVLADDYRATLPVLQQEARNIYEHQAAARHLTPAPPGRRLAADEHCVGGSIVRVDVVHGVTTYTQEMGGHLPMACPQGVFY